MDYRDNERKSRDSIDELRHANERRVEELLNINNRYVRTERHLEQNSDIASLEQLKYSFELQKDREEKMENLKNLIAYGKHQEDDEKENLEKRIAYTDHYLQHHSGHMDGDALQNTQEKQEHRREHLEFLD